MQDIFNPYQIDHVVRSMNNNVNIPILTINVKVEEIKYRKNPVGKIRIPTREVVYSVEKKFYMGMSEETVVKKTHNKALYSLILKSRQGKVIKSIFDNYNVEKGKIIHNLRSRTYIPWTPRYWIAIVELEVDNDVVHCTINCDKRFVLCDRETYEKIVCE